MKISMNSQGYYFPYVSNQEFFKKFLIYRGFQATGVRHVELYEGIREVIIDGVYRSVERIKYVVADEIRYLIRFQMMFAKGSYDLDDFSKEFGHTEGS